MTTLKPLGAYSSTAELYADAQARIADLEAVEKMRDEEIAAVREKAGNDTIRLEAQLESERSAYKGQELLMNDYISELAAAESRLREVEAALNKIASWPEGKIVNGSFDEPGSAQIARDALAPDRTAADRNLCLKEKDHVLCHYFLGHIGVHTWEVAAPTLGKFNQTAINAKAETNKENGHE